MTTIKLDKKEYVVLPKKEYEALLAKAASKKAAAKKLTLEQGKKLAYKLIDGWAAGK